MGLGDSSPNSSELALVPALAGLVDVDTSLAHVVVGARGVVDSIEVENGLVRVLDFSGPLISCETRLDPESNWGSTVFLADYGVFFDHFSWIYKRVIYFN